MEIDLELIVVGDQKSLTLFNNDLPAHLRGKILQQKGGHRNFYWTSIRNVKDIANTENELERFFLDYENYIHGDFSKNFLTRIANIIAIGDSNDVNGFFISKSLMGIAQKLEFEIDINIDAS